jgi:simple sugar transport system ATP-binding protein
MQIMRNLVKENKSILFISHKLNEIMAVSQRVTVLRKGKFIGTVMTKDTSMEELSRMMVGRDVLFDLKKSDVKPGRDVLNIKDLTVLSVRTKKPAVNKLSLTVRQGEIVGVAGIEGNGQSELAYALSGILPTHEGSIQLDGQSMTKASVRKRNNAGLAHIPEDRQRYGLVLDFPLYFNLNLKKYHRSPMNKLGFLQFNLMKENSEKLIDQFDIRTSQRSLTDTRSMSGGNQQKAIIAREIDLNGSCILCVQLTRGLDVGAIEYIHQQLLKQRELGKAILLISFELDEILKLSDRIVVMFDGEIVKTLDPKQTNQEEIGIYMAGGHPHA